MTPIGVPFRTRLLRIERGNGCWRLWTETRDFVLGTYILLWDDGRVQTVTERAGEGPEIINAKGVDDATFW